MSGVRRPHPRTRADVIQHIRLRSPTGGILDGYAIARSATDTERGHHIEIVVIGALDDMGIAIEMVPLRLPYAIGAEITL